MNTNKTLLATVMLAFGLSGMTQAQTCASPLTLKDGTSASGDTCGGKNQSGTLCGAFSSPENDIVYSLTIPDSAKASTFTLTNNTPGWNAGLVLLSGSCGGGVSCSEVADNAGKGGSETINVPAGAGKYFLIVTSSPGSGGCGSFSLSSGAPAVQVKEATAK